MKPSRPVIAFALLRHCGDSMHTDLLGGVSVLIRPLVSDLTGQVYDATVLAERMATAYGISLPASALEEFTSRLIKAGILKSEVNANGGVSRAIYAEMADEGKDGVQDEAQFQEIIDDFLDHASDHLAIAGRAIGTEKLISGFLRRLCTFDFSSIRARPLVVEQQNSSTLLGPAAKEARAASEDLSEDATIDALVASFITDLQAKNADWLRLLSEVADGALGLELVLDLQAPTSVPRLVNTTAIIDTPLLLAYMDLSSKQQHDVATVLINQLIQSGAKIAAFQHSIDEAESILYAIETARHQGGAYGPTVARMSSASYRAYFQTMRGRIALVWQEKHKFELIQETATQFYKNFTEDDEIELTQRIRTSIVDRYLTSERDAKSVAETIRRLGGGHIPVSNIASCKFMFVTGNGSVQRRSAAFLRERGFVRRGEFMPIVTDRYIAGLCWLISGGRSDESPSTARLLANCATALRARPELIERTKKFLSDLDEQKATHFEALMTNERASQYLVEVTLGNLDVITANNVEDVFEEAQRRAAESVSKEKDAFYGEKIAQMTAEMESDKEKVTAMQNKIAEVELENAAKDLVTQGLSKESAALKEEFRAQQEVLGRQARDIEQMTENLKKLTNAAESAADELARRKAEILLYARRFADSRLRIVRVLGCIGVLLLSFCLGYLDKFMIPKLSAQNQDVANIALIVAQAVVAILGLSILFDKVFGTPLKRWREKIYRNRLAELGHFEQD